MVGDLSEALTAYETGQLEKCLLLINEAISSRSDDVDALMLKAQIHYKQQEWGKALNVLNTILDFDGENERARNYKQMVMSILTYWNKDRYNP